jgi:hypothetical protein
MVLVSNRRKNMKRKKKETQEKNQLDDVHTSEDDSSEDAYEEELSYAEEAFFDYMMADTKEEKAEIVSRLSRIENSIYP